MIHVLFLRYLLTHPVAFVLLLLFGWFLYSLKEIVFIVFLAYIFVAALSPPVDFLHRKGLPRVIAIILIYLIILLPVAAFNYYVLPPLAGQTQQFFEDLPKYIEELTQALNINFSPQQFRTFVTSRLADIISNATTFAFAVFGGVFAIITFIFINFYWLLDHKKVHGAIAALFPDKKKTSLILNRIENKLGAWARGQLILSVAVAFMTWIALLMIGIPYALPIAIFAGIIEFIPAIGPIIGFTPAFILAYTISPLTLLFVVIAYIIIQIIEGNILVPKVMQQAVGLHPLVVLLGLVIGAQLLGLMGAIISIPVITLAAVVIKELQKVYEQK